MIIVTATGNFEKTRSFFKKALNFVNMGMFDKYGRKGVEELKKSTPKDTGKTSESWSYKVEKNNNRVSIVWSNSNINNGQSIALLIQYGHRSKSGYWIEGVDYINPALIPIFNDMGEEIWLEVTKR